MEWLTAIKIEELPKQYREMAEIIGVENTIRLAEYFGKTPVYFPSIDPVIREKKKQYIIENFRGDNHYELARATEYSLVWVYDILKEHKKAQQRKQRKLFPPEA